MIEYKIYEKESILIATPKSPITVEDFNNISKDVDNYLQKHSMINGVVIYVKNFKGWENFSSLINHLKFVKNHHEFIKKLAVVTDDTILSYLPNIASHFVNAKIKHFNYIDKGKAIQWINNPKIRKHGIFIGIKKIEDNFFIKMKLEGKLTHEDYETMIPAIEDAIKNTPNAKLNILVNGLELEGWEIQAAWDDLKFGLKHSKEFNKIAYVGTKTWEEYGIKISNWFFNGEIKYFENEQSAIKWLRL